MNLRQIGQKLCIFNQWFNFLGCVIFYVTDSKKEMRTSKVTEYQELVAALRTKVLSGGCWCHCGHCTNLRINSDTHLRVRVDPKGCLVVIRTPVIPVFNMLGSTHQ